MGRFATGLHVPNPAKLARRVTAPHPLMARATLRGPRGDAALTPCPRLNQKSKGICHAFSAAGAVWTALQAAGKAPPWIPSPRLIASCTYADVQGPADTRGPLQDTGADLSDDATALATWGIAAIQPTSTDDGICDVDDLPDDGLFPEPDAGRIVIAGADLISGEYAIPVDSNASERCAVALDAGIPIWFGGPVNDAYQALRAGDVATSAAVVGGAGHAQYFSAYRTRQGGKREFLIQGSWGLSFADAGAVWADETYLTAQWILWPFAVVV